MSAPGQASAGQAVSREQVIAALAEAFGPHLAAISRPADEDHRHPWTEFVPSGNDERGTTLITFRDTDGCNSIRALTYGEIADALTTTAALAAREPGAAPELLLGPCPFEGHDGEHLRLNTHGHWLCAITLTNMLVAADVIAEPQHAPRDEGTLTVDDFYAERAERLHRTGERDAARSDLARVKRAVLGTGTHQAKIKKILAITGEIPDETPAEQPAPELAAAPALGTAWRLLNQLRAAVTALAEDLEHSAKAAAPSKKSAIEETVAERLRILLEGK